MLRLATDAARGVRRSHQSRETDFRAAVLTFAEFRSTDVLLRKLDPRQFFHLAADDGDLMIHQHIRYRGIARISDFSRQIGKVLMPGAFQLAANLAAKFCAAACQCIGYLLFLCAAELAHRDISLKY